uniref:Uncharacterized protein n=1 Tax=Amphimedon queenslandica TaxID=400682 RepID=A0A1X7UEX0_AMPQE
LSKNLIGSLIENSNTRTHKHTCNNAFSIFFIFCLHQWLNFTEATSGCGISVPVYI